MNETISLRQALNMAMAQEMRRDPDIFLMGEEVAEYDGAYKVSKGLLLEFGKDRVIDTPISEAGFAGLGVGAAMAGLRPIIEMMTWNFAIQAFDQIINHAAKMRYMSGGQFTMPLVYRGPNGCAHMLSSQHSQYVEPMLTNVPGLKVVCPSNPNDAKGLLKTAIRDDNCVIFLESEMMYGIKGEVDVRDDYLIPFEKARIEKAGSDVTVISWGKSLWDFMKFQEKIADELDVSMEVIDLRSLQPYDKTTVNKSIQKTNRLLVVEQSWGFASVGSEIIADVVQNQFDYLDAPPLKVSCDFVPIPYNPKLEKHVLPNEDKIKAAIMKLIA